MAEEATSNTPTMDVNERMDMCRKVWKTDYARILMHAKATSELSAYERCHSAVKVNKGISFGLVPLVGVGAYAHIWKTKPTDISKHRPSKNGRVKCSYGFDVTSKPNQRAGRGRFEQ